MNRFSTYLTSQKLAKAHLQEAEARLRSRDVRLELVVASLIQAVREFQTSTNCIASLAFEPRKKRRTKTI